MQKMLWTIGHSTREISEFIEILKFYHIKQVVDIRALPGSNKYPHFNNDRLKESLSEFGLEYKYIKQLSGLRKRIKDAPPNVWKNKSFSNYAAYMETADFKEGIDQLTNYALRAPTVIMCAEVLWWRCHRSLIADYMKSIGWDVINIQDSKTKIPHPYTSAASIIDGNLSYAVIPKKN